MYRGSDSIVASRVGHVPSVIGSDAVGNRAIDPGLAICAWILGQADAADGRNGRDETYETDGTYGTFSRVDCVGNRTSGKIVIAEPCTPYLTPLQGSLQGGHIPGVRYASPLAEICCHVAVTHWFRLIQVLQLQEMDLAKFVGEPCDEHSRQNRDQEKTKALWCEPRLARNEGLRSDWTGK
jgi:hypothetical protein